MQKENWSIVLAFRMDSGISMDFPLPRPCVSSLLRWLIPLSLIKKWVLYQHVNHTSVSKNITLMYLNLVLISFFMFLKAARGFRCRCPNQSLPPQRIANRGSHLPRCSGWWDGEEALEHSQRDLCPPGPRSAVLSWQVSLTVSLTMAWVGLLGAQVCQHLPAWILF